MRAGLLRHRVEIQARTTAQDPTYGAQQQVWTTVATAYADIDEQSGREVRLEGGAFYGEGTLLVTMRYWPGVLTTAHRLKFGNRIFDIVQPPADDRLRKASMQLLVKEGVSQG